MSRLPSRKSLFTNLRRWDDGKKVNWCSYFKSQKAKLARFRAYEPGEHPKGDRRWSINEELVEQRLRSGEVTRVLLSEHDTDPWDIGYEFRTPDFLELLQEARKIHDTDDYLSLHERVITAFLKRNPMAVITKRTTTNAVTVRNDPFADAGGGSEHVKPGDLIIPRLGLLHEMSKVTKKHRTEYIKGAQGGMWCIPSLQKLYSGEAGVFLIPVLYQRRFHEWHPYESGGGLVRLDVPEEELEGMVKKNPGVYLTDNDTEVVVTPEYYALLVDLDTGNSQPVVMSLTGKKSQVSRRWNTVIMAQTRSHPRTGEDMQMPFWFNTYHFTSVAESNDKGDFYMPTFVIHGETLALEHGERLYTRARTFYESIKSGKARASEEDDR